MPRFLRLQNSVIHVPSVSNVSMGSSCLAKPFLSVTYHTGPKVTCLSYTTWTACEQDFNTLKSAMKEIETLLTSVPLTTPEVVVEAKVVEVTTPVAPTEVRVE